MRLTQPASAVGLCCGEASATRWDSAVRALGWRKASGDCSAGSGSVCVPVGDRVACHLVAELAVNDAELFVVPGRD